VPLPLEGVFGGQGMPMYQFGYIGVFSSIYRTPSLRCTFLYHSAPVSAILQCMNEQDIETALNSVSNAQAIIVSIAYRIKPDPLNYYQMQAALKLADVDNALVYLEKAIKNAREDMNNNFV